MNTQHPSRPRIAVFTVLLAVLLAGFVGAAVAQDRTERELQRGHEALNAERYRRAAEHFAQAGEMASERRIRAEALYWEAFALQREGGMEELREAAARLQHLQEEDYYGQARALAEEVQALETKIKSELARRGDARAAREITEMADEQDDMELKIMAIQGMVNMNPERAKPILIKVLKNRDAGTAELRSQAVFLLAQADVEGVEDVMVDVVREDPDPEVRQQAVFWLAQVGSEKAADVLVDLILHGDDPELQSHAIFALSQGNSERTSDVLRDVALDENQDPENREAAIFWLGQSGGEEHLEFLRDLYGRLEDEELKERVLFSVAQTGAEGVGDWLVDVALDENEDIESRKMAIFWAGQQGMLPVDRLDEIYREADDREFRGQILFVLSQDGGDEALTMLMDLARDEKDLELRKEAVFWIGQIGGEQAEEFLLEIINEDGRD